MSVIVLTQLIPVEVLVQIRECTARGRFVEGRSTAVGRAAMNKQNLQLALDDPAERRAVQLLVGALQSSPLFQEAAWPDALMRPLFARYEPGMRYGDHVDGALLGVAPNLIRCDLALTICINDGSEYDGGELVIDSAGVGYAWKGSAGDAIAFAADTLHRVNEVKRGVRDVAVVWVQSMVRDAARRRILFDLRSVLDSMDLAAQPSSHVETVRRTYFNLIRMWTE